MICYFLLSNDTHFEIAFDKFDDFISFIKHLNDFSFATGIHFSFIFEQVIGEFSFNNFKVKDIIL